MMLDVCLRLLWIAPLVAVAGCGGTSADSACTDEAAARCNQRSMCTSGAGPDPIS
jgi:hypothetical protein